MGRSLWDTVISVLVLLFLLDSKQVRYALTSLDTLKVLMVLFVFYLIPRTSRGTKCNSNTINIKFISITD